MTIEQLKTMMVADVSTRAKAALTCLGCGTTGDFGGSPTTKEAMIQIAKFKRAHWACGEGPR